MDPPPVSLAAAPALPEAETLVTALWPVYVASKGRAGRLTPEVLSLAPILILEAGERARYYKAHPELAQRRLGEAHRGVSYARNGLMVAARNDGAQWCWMLDDDLTDFHRRRKDSEPVPLEPAEALLAAQELILRAKPPMRRPVALAGLPVAWARVGAEQDEMRSPDRVRFGVNCYCCVALHLPSLIGLTYREELKLREDTDFSLQVLARGLSTLRCDDLAYQMPICGTGSGGLAATYAQEQAHAKANARMAEIWPGIFHTGGDCRHYWCDWKKAAGQPRGKPVPLWRISGEATPASVALSEGPAASDNTTGTAFALPCAEAV